MNIGLRCSGGGSSSGGGDGGERSLDGDVFGFGFGFWNWFGRGRGWWEFDVDVVVGDGDVRRSCERDGSEDVFSRRGGRHVGLAGR